MKLRKPGNNITNFTTARKVNYYYFIAARNGEGKKMRPSVALPSAVKIKS